jgi:hypothetical protein
MRGNFTHGLRKSKLYITWANMKQRCYNPNDSHYKWYGGRGVTICDEWKNDFKAFYDWAIANGYRDSLTIDRVDSTKNYSPDNCRFITMSAQQRNKSSNKYIEYNGETKSVQEWAEKLNIKPSTLRARFNKGWSIERALSEPVRVISL